MRRDEIKRTITALMGRLGYPESNWGWMDNDLYLIDHGSSKTFRIPPMITKQRFEQIVKEIEVVAANRREQCHTT